MMETDILLTSYITGNCSAEETQRVRDWIAASADNRQYFEEMKKTWDASKKVIPVLHTDEQEAWGRFQQLLSLQKKKPAIPWLRAAAIFMVIAGCATIFYLRRPNPDTTALTPDQYVTAESGDLSRTEKLPDGSVVVLDKHSSIYYPAVFKEETRPVRLKGNGKFSVSPNAGKPFIISVNDLSIKVIGTAFTVKSDVHSTTIKVISGRVKLLKGRDSAMLEKEESINVPVNDTVPMTNYILDKIDAEKLLQLLRDAKEHLIEGDTLHLKIARDREDSLLIKKKIRLFNAIYKNANDSLPKHNINDSSH